MKTNRYIIIVLSFLLLVSCEDWLDVAPASTLKQEDLFNSQKGYLDALHGVYMGLLDNGLYGRELTFGMLDAMGQYWTSVSVTPSTATGMPGLLTMNTPVSREL
jgi:starch-binding outer membrane protein, SusD/RagB family